MRSRFVALLLLLPPALACSRDDSSVPPELLAYGAEPRQEIELDPRPLVPERHMELEVTMVAGMQHGAQSETDKRTAPVRIALGLGRDASAEGAPSRASFTIENVTLTEPGNDPEQFKTWQEELARFDPKNLRGKLAFDRFGRAESISFALPKQTPGGVRQLLLAVKSTFDLFAVPRAEGAVGIGARIRDRRDVDLLGMKLALDATYVLAAIEDDSLAFDVEMSFHGLPQPFELPTVKDKSSRAELLNAEAKGKGRVVVARHHVGPREGRLDLQIGMKVRMLYEGKESTLDSAIDLGIALRAR